MPMHEKQQMKKDAKQKNEISDLKSNISFRCRGSVTRTRDRLVPNQERYQLRYTPNIILLKLPRTTLWAVAFRKRVQRYYFFNNMQKIRLFFQ